MTEKEAGRANSQEAEEGVPFFPIHFLKEIMVIFISLGVLITLVTFIPAPMEPKADPFFTPEHIKPEWYFLAPYQLLKVADYLSFLGQWAPKLLGVVGQGVIMAILIFLPFIDRRPERHPFRRPLAVILGILAVLAFVGLTIWGHYS
ncbi:MAG: hypothetical protein V3S39_07515 [Thermodesulfobacteriota bacterium]